MRLSQVGNDLSWRDFALGVDGLLSAPTRLAHRLRPEGSADPEVSADG